MKIGQVEFTWRAHRQACVVKIGGEQRVFRFNKKTTRKELFAKIRSLIAEAAGTQAVTLERYSCTAKVMSVNVRFVILKNMAYAPSVTKSAVL